MKKTIVSLCMVILSTGATQAGWDEQAMLSRRLADGSFSLEKYAMLQPTTYTNAVFFDYNNDGYLDLLIMGKGGDWNIKSNKQFVQLYQNLGPDADFAFSRVIDTGFAQQCDEGFYNPISVGDYNHDGYTDVIIMSSQNGRHVDLYLNDSGTGKFAKQSLAFDAATNGSVMLGDLNCDGWLDVEFSGYSDSTSTALKLYLNNRDGTFTDATPKGITGAFQGQSTLADLDGDGCLDIISTGNGDNWTCLASVYHNTIAEGSFGFSTVSNTGLAGVSRANVLCADFNADGRPDLIINGEPADGSGFRTRIYYQNAEGKFKLDDSYPLVPVNQDGGINMGDTDGDGNMDIIVGGYVGTYVSTPSAYYSSPLRIYENHPENANIKANNFPEPPKTVKAEVYGDSIRIAWTSGSDAESKEEALRYNLFVRNDNTGEIFCLIPADLQTGHLKVGTDLQTSLSSRVTNYSMKLLGEGNYTVGVQTLDQAFAGSKFRTASITTGVRTLDKPQRQIKAFRVDGGIVVKADKDTNVKVYNICGQLIATGKANHLIQVSNFESLIVKADNTTFKM